MNNDTNILLRNGYVAVPSTQSKKDTQAIATILMNLEYYGYCLSEEAFRSVQNMSKNALAIWWSGIEAELKSITGDDRKIDDFVVYKNFPKEVIEKTEAEYWIAQILMYWGFPNHYYTQVIEPREGMEPSERNSKTLLLASTTTLQTILNGLLEEQARWKPQQLQDILALAKTQYVNVESVVFKENLVALVSHFVQMGVEIKLKSATDVLRLAVGLSDGDVSLRQKTQFMSFNRKTRRFLMNMLESSTNLVEDVARRKGVWKKFLHRLHPGEFQKSYPKTAHVADNLYNDKFITFNSKIEKGLRQRDLGVLNELASRPGEFMRRLTHTLDVYGEAAVDALSGVISSLSNQQVVSIRRHLEVANTRTTRLFTPKGNWNRLQVGVARPINPTHVETLCSRLGSSLRERVPSVATLDPDVELIKLPNSGGDTGSYSRGTTFKIPDEVKFIRTASYWRSNNKMLGNIWFDNGWNFFDESWNPTGHVCWNYPKFMAGNKPAAAFSGDPTNIKNDEGKATQIIDLYLDSLIKVGVRYAVWNVISFNQIPFKEADEVFAALQWGHDAEKSKLFEPSRCQLAFPLIGDYKTKYVCVIDLKARQMTYIDANLKADVSSASKNGKTLRQQMPAFMDYIRSLPTVHDLFKESINANAEIYGVLYTDQGIKLSKDQQAYVFMPQTGQDFTPIDLNKILGGS